MDLKNIRVDYKKSKINFDKLDKNPIDLFLKRFNEALAIDGNEANACVLSTVSTDGKPSSRVVLLKAISDKGFTFFTNYKSDKSRDIENNNFVALNFYWPVLESQIRITGEATKIDPKESDDYFKSRPRESQMGAWLSDQSKAIDLKYNFTDLLSVLESRFKGKEVARPLTWGGYCVNPNKIEFWQGRPSRFHDRLLYEYDGKEWSMRRLAP